MRAGPQQFSRPLRSFDLSTSSRHRKLRDHREGIGAGPGPEPGGRVLRGAPSGWRFSLRTRSAPGLGRLRNRLGPTGVRPRARGDAAGCAGRRVAGAGAIPADVGGGGLVAERIRAAAEWPGAPGGRAAGRRPAGGAGSAGRGGGVDAVGPGGRRRRARGRKWAAAWRMRIRSWG